MRTHKNVFNSSMVNEPSGFEPLKFYCGCVRNGIFLGGGLSKVLIPVTLLANEADNKLTIFFLCIPEDRH